MEHKKTNFFSCLRQAFPLGVPQSICFGSVCCFQSFFPIPLENTQSPFCVWLLTHTFLYFSFCKHLPQLLHHFLREDGKGDPLPALRHGIYAPPWGGGAAAPPPPYPQRHFVPDHRAAPAAYRKGKQPAVAEPTPCRCCRTGAFSALPLPSLRPSPRGASAQRLPPAHMPGLPPDTDRYRY